MTCAAAFKKSPERVRTLWICVCALLLMLLAVIPGTAFAQDNKASESDYVSGYVQIDGVYAFDADTYPYGSYTMCGGYDMDSGAWTKDTPTITEKGQRLQLEARGTFVSGDLDSDKAVIEDGIVLSGSEVTWKVDDSSIATIDFQSGVLTPLKNGTVQVTVTLISSKAYYGKEMSVTFPVTIDISEAAYITGLRVLAPDGSTPISQSDTGFYDLYAYACTQTDATDFATVAATVTPQFYVAVTVYDPATESETTYTVKNGTELAEKCGISDLVWAQVADSTKYSIDASLGMIRMLYESSSSAETISVSTHTTADGSRLESRANLRFATDETMAKEDEGEAGYEPSDTLTIKVYYEEYPADIYDDEDENWLKLENYENATSVTFTVDDLKAISSQDEAFTMIGETRSCQAIASGVNLMELLQNVLGSQAGISDIEGFYFGTFDQGYLPGQYMVSATNLFQDRYFYPYYFQGGDKTGAVQVWPILAWSSKLYWSNLYSDIDVSNHDNWDRSAMSSASQYRLIFGALEGSGFSTKNSVYCIQTMYVVLKGGPKVGPDEGDDGGDGGDDSGSGGGSGSGDDSQGSGSGTTGGDPTDSGAGTDEQQPTQNTTSAGASDGAGEEASGTQSAKAPTVYQMINNNELNVALNVSNTLGWLVLPLSLLALLAGVLYALLWYRRQTAPVT